MARKLISYKPPQTEESPLLPVDNPLPSANVNQTLQDATNCADHHYKSLRNERRKTVRAKQASTHLKTRVRTLEASVQHLSAQLVPPSLGSLDFQSGGAGIKKALTASVEQKLVKVKERLTKAEATKQDLRRRNHLLQMHVKRIPHQKALAGKKAFQKGIRSGELGKTYRIQKDRAIQDTARDLVRDLVAYGVPAASVNDTLHRVAETLDVSTTGNISARSVGRIVLEGGLASDLQFVEDVQQSTGITLSCDGMTHRHTNYESRQAVTIKQNGERMAHFLGVQSAVSHTNPREFIIKTTGLHTDHAEDQKKLVRLVQLWKKRIEREVRGEQALKTMASEEVLTIICEASQQTIEAAGGLDRWDQLSASEKEA
ncbi:hypothetical protein EVG20_g11625, partial [Dentipellis fragilis]